MSTEERLEIIKQISEKVMVNNQPEKKKRCTSCKKKKEVIMTELPQVIEMEYIPDAKDIKLAYEELTSYGGVKEDKKEFISKVYNQIFNEDLIYNCNSCVSTQAKKFKHYITSKLNIKL
jgi:hypothetical protein